MKKRIFLIILLGLVIAGCELGQKQAKEPNISLYITETGQKKEMPLEEYLYGVVAGEMLPNWPKEAYAAQAIIARTFTMEFLQRGGTKEKYGTDLSDDITETQAYNPNAITAEIKKAVDQTKGIVAKYNNEYIKGWFHAYSGGETTSASVGLGYAKGEPPYIKSVKDPGDNYAPPEDRNWSAIYAFSELTSLLKEKGFVSFTVDSVEITKKNEQGRAMEFTVTGEGQSKIIPGAEFRIALDSTKLKSIWITKLEKTDSGVTFFGKGYGHGVGMSQWGAYGLAEQGKKAEEIVKYFFQGIKLEKIYR